MTWTRPCRRITLQLSQIFLTLGRTFNGSPLARAPRLSAHRGTGGLGGAGAAGGRRGQRPGEWRGRARPAQGRTDTLARVRVATNTYRSHLASALQSLGNKDRISGVDAAALQVQSYLSCPECPTRVSVEQAYEQGYVCADHHGD